MKKFSFVILIVLIFAVPAFATVTVSKPTNGDTTGSPVQFVATATTNCSSGVASVGVYINGDLKHVNTGKSLNTSISLSPGTYSASVHEWDNCGGSTQKSETFKVTGKTGVFVTAPANNSTVSTNVAYAATASTSSCAQGVNSMGIYVDGVKKYTVNGAKLNTQLSMASGTHQTTVKEWDHCGGSAATPIKVTVKGASGKVISNIQALPNWNVWGQLAPKYAICTSCKGVTLSMTKHIKSPSKSGNATEFKLGGTKAYSDALFSNKLIGQGTTINMPDNNRTVIPNIHNFTYEADVDITNAKATQALEIDVDMYLNSVGMIWGAECDHLNTGKWKLWNNVDTTWVTTGFACPVTDGWHHLTFTVERESNNVLLYKSLTWDGVTHTINKTYKPFKVASSWYGVTVNWQMDGNNKQAAYSTYVDNFNLHYQ